MSAAFADTFFFLALLNQEDLSHDRAKAESRIPRNVITTEFIILELGNACAKGEDHADFLRLVDGLRGSPRVKIVPADSQLLNRGLELMRQRPDKNWSLTDCTSFIVMGDTGLRQALTGDQHFEQAGFQALLK